MTTGCIIAGLTFFIVSLKKFSFVEKTYIEVVNNVCIFSFLQFEAARKFKKRSQETPAETVNRSAVPCRDDNNSNESGTVFMIRKGQYVFKQNDRIF